MDGELAQTGTFRWPRESMMESLTSTRSGIFVVGSVSIIAYTNIIRVYQKKKRKKMILFRTSTLQVNGID